MKKFFLLLVICFVLTSVNAQKVEVTTAGDAVVTTIYEKEVNDVMREWKSLMKKNKGKIESEDKKVIARAAVINSISDGGFDVIATFDEPKKGEVKMTVLFDPLAYSTTGTPDKSKFIGDEKKFVKEFAVEQTKEGIKELLKLEQKALDKLTDQQKDMQKRKEKLEAEIQRDQDEIKKDQDEIKQNVEDQKIKSSEIETQNKMVEMVQKRLSGVE